MNRPRLSSLRSTAPLGKRSTLFLWPYRVYHVAKSVRLVGLIPNTMPLAVWRLARVGARRRLLGAVWVFRFQGSRLVFLSGGAEKLRLCGPPVGCEKQVQLCGNEPQFWI